MDMFTHSLTASSHSRHHPHHQHRVTILTSWILTLPGHVCVSWKIPHSCDMSDVILDNSSNLINIYTVKAALTPYYGWCWNCSSLVLYISDWNQGVFNIIISQYYSKITNLNIRKTLITRKDVTRKEKVDICWVYSTWAENKLSTAYRNEAVELQIRGYN